MKTLKPLVTILMICLLCACAQVGPQLKQFNDQVAGGVRIAADVILVHWNLYSWAVRDAMGKDLEKDENFSLKNALQNLDKLYTKRAGDIKNLRDEDCVDTCFWYGKVITTGAPKAIAAFAGLVAEVSAYFK